MNFKDFRNYGDSKLVPFVYRPAKILPGLIAIPINEIRTAGKINKKT